MEFEHSELTLVEPRIERPGRQIKLGAEITGNKNISVTIGTTEDKNRPSTVYLTASFWVDLKDRMPGCAEYDRQVSKTFSKALRSIYINTVKPILIDSTVFPHFYENIYTFDFPENLNYNNKRSFVSIDLHIHTCNSNKKNPPLGLKNKAGTEIYDQLVQVVQAICSSPLLKGELEFSVHKQKK